LNIIDETKINRDLIHQLPQIMRTSQPTFQKTGGLHASALFSSIGELRVIREDIGRHNALDKVVGAALRSAIIPAPGLILCVSGRMSYEIVQKALVARIPVIAGIGAPSSLAVAMANDFHVTLLGFVRDNSYNIYSCPERLIG
jgi:FdhD protein